MIRESKVKKGGLGMKPSTERPLPPKGSSSYDDLKKIWDDFNSFEKVIVKSGFHKFIYADGKHSYLVVFYEERKGEKYYSPLNNVVVQQCIKVFENGDSVELPVDDKMVIGFCKHFLSEWYKTPLNKLPKLVIDTGFYLTRSGRYVAVNEIKDHSDNYSVTRFNVKGTIYSRTKAGRIKKEHCIWHESGRKFTDKENYDDLIKRVDYFKKDMV